MAVEEQYGAECLVLRRRGDILLCCQVCEKCPDFWFAHFQRMAFVVEKYEALDPVDIGFFRAP